MATFRILDNTPLRFVRDQDWNKPQTERNRLQKNYLYYGKINQSFSLEFDKADSLFFQYRTDYQTVNISMRKSDGSIIVGNTSTSLIKIYDDERKQYQVNISLTGLSGCYEVLISAKSDSDKPITSYTSEPIYVTDSDLGYIEWFGNVALNDPFIWGETRARLRCEFMLKDPINEPDKATYTDTDGNELPTYALPKNVRNLKIKKVPEWVKDSLNLAFQHDTTFINNVQYSSKALFEHEETAGRMFSLKLSVIQHNFYNFVEDEELDGIKPVLEQKYKLINATDYTLINATDKVKVNN